MVDFTLSTRVTLRVALPRRVRRGPRRMKVPRNVRPYRRARTPARRHCPPDFSDSSTTYCI